MKSRGLILGTFLAALVVLAFQPAKPAAAQQPMPGVNGRYMIVVSPMTARDVVLLDTQTGRSWLMCDTKTDSLVRSPYIVQTNWCAMQLVGTPARP